MAAKSTTVRNASTYSALLGAAAGLAIGLLSLPFATFDGSVPLALYLAISMTIGGVLGWLTVAIPARAARADMMDLVEQAGRKLNVQVGEVQSPAEAGMELRRVLERASSALEQVRSVNARIRALTAEVLAATEQQASGAAEQAAAVSQTSATLEELAQTSKQIADNSESVVRVAERTLAGAEEGMTAVSDTAAGIEEIRMTTQQASDRILTLGERSQEIGRVLVIIDEIAEQTKILALNAAIEAARAGEAGKGFAVVAEEIRKLADSVTESTQEIGRVVREIQSSSSALIMSTEKAAKKVDEGKDLAHRTADVLDRIVGEVEQTTDAAKQISIATQQQRTASDQVVVSMREVSQVSQQAAESSRQVSMAIMELNRLADTLLSL